MVGLGYKRYVVYDDAPANATDPLQGTGFISHGSYFNKA
jgi:hypothetical protein